MNLKTVSSNIFKSISNTILDIFYPKRCIICNSFVNIGKKISVCKCCRKILKDRSMVIRENDKYFEETVCSLEYTDYVKKSMSDFKFFGLEYLGKTFAWTVYENVKDRAFLKEVSFICPVPLHHNRAREYNQSELIAKELSAYSHIPVIRDVLVKVKDLTPLSKMNYAKRRYMIKSAFAFNPLYDISGKTVCLVDDIYTTSATVNECSRILKLYGAKAVYVLCPCYAQRKKGENKDAHTDFADN